MARTLTILDRTDDTPSSVTFRVAYWLTVPTARQEFYANASFQSAIQGNTKAGLTNTEISDLQAGRVTEVVEHPSFGKNADGTLPMAAIQQQLINRASALQNHVNAHNPWVRYGTTYDPATSPQWTVRTVA